MGYEIHVSVVMLVKNGGALVSDTIRVLLSQQYADPFEVLVIDSGSTDGSPTAIKTLFADHGSNPTAVTLRFFEIDSAEFGHGRTRNDGARLALGSIVVFLSQDAVPAGPDWLTRLLTPFRDPSVSASFCRQIPRPHVSLPEQFILETAYPRGSSIRTKRSIARRGADYIMFSNAASAIRREILSAHPFREDLMMCEDAHWAVEVLQDGGTIAYVADTSVIHAHGYSIPAILRRSFDYAVTLKGLPGAVSAYSYMRYLRREIQFVLHRAGPLGLPHMCIFEGARVAGYLLGNRAHKLPAAVCRQLTGYPGWFSRPKDVAAPDNTHVDLDTQWLSYRLQPSSEYLERE